MVIDHIIEMLPDLNKAFFETIYMVGISLLVAILIGLPLGVILFVTDEGMFLKNKFVKTIVGFLINLIRSIPFIILLVLLIPFTMLIVGKVIGPTAASVSISVAAIPFFARIVETAFREIDKGVIEASISVGATPWMIIKDVLIPEAKSSIIQGVTLTTISLVAYSAMAGVVGGGGIGDLAIRYGYYRYDTVIMFTTVLVLIVLVQLIQLLGDRWAKHADKR
ncbi:ABC transporter permease [Bacillus sp. FJAT-49732]|uniref:ABC transporter permease n=1 Tax=Lederbergia citrisecunda TaxID=2833583 RepID=A0A942TRM6_9BACI|nr:methionine ABC transporter permease [Lederbergia citrisecunda]MBS4201616.1 ABC transporter permease [Lederbergia citrisecunda]